MFWLFARVFSTCETCTADGASRWARQEIPSFADTISGKMAVMSDTSPDPSPWWQPHIHKDRRPFLTARTKMSEAARSFFSAESFVEVDTAILQVSPGNEAHISAFGTEIIDDAG